jgi:enoyl-CoA hydratase
VTDTAPASAAPRPDRRFIDAAFPATGPDGSLDGVALVTIDRQEALNALSFDLLDELATTLETLDRDPTCRAIVLTGAGSRAFAAGADINELARQTPITLTLENRFSAAWDRIGAVRTPTIAAVRGFALGGGCELAMTCDMIVAGEDAQFGQPEIRLGVMPGAGGTQRLTRAIGKAKAMELILTGRTMPAREAESAGLVTRVVPAEATMDAALELAGRVAAQAPVATLAAKQAIREADELPLSSGLEAERRAFFLLFASDDQTEGMAAFTEKRPAHWTGR